MIVKRQGLIVWYKHQRFIKQIRRYGHLLYYSRKQKYAVLYTDMETVEEVKKHLGNKSFITKVQYSKKPHIRTTFEKKPLEKVKDYDYNLGI